MAAFDDVQLPVNVEVGAQGGPQFSTGIITMANGQEQRTQAWSFARSAYTVGYGISEDDWPVVRAFFYARRGRARGFRFKDWTDFAAVAEPVRIDTTGNITLIKTYADDAGIAYQRQITRVVPGTLTVFDMPSGSVRDLTQYFTESYGLLTPKNGAPAYGSLYATYEFDIPVRFDVDDFVITAATFKAATLDGIKIVELIENSLTLNGK